MTKLDGDGYIILRNTIDINFGAKCIKNNKVDYKCIYKVINRNYFPVIKKQIPDSDGATFRRYIFMNSNNSSLDTLYHANSYNKTETNLIPIYCAYIYFNSGTLELIPGSHLKSQKINYSSKVVINMQEGDIIILNTNLHNRDINSGTSKVLKILDIFPNESILNNYGHNLIVIQMSKSIIIQYITFVLIFMSKVGCIINSFNYMYYILVFYNIQHKFLLEKENGVGKIVSYEATECKLLTSVKEYEKWNTYIRCDTGINTTYIGNNLAILLVLSMIIIGVGINLSFKNKEMIKHYKDLIIKYSPTQIKEQLINK
jgi:hypothetical protein